MAVYLYQLILSMYTLMIPFSRYDVLLYELGRLMLTDIKGESHVLNKAYRSYNTYRKNITPDSSKLKINETYNNRDAIEENYYDLNSLDTSYVFDGIVLSKKYATNGNEMSLEDLFSEYYYEYLTAVDSSYLYSPEYGTTYYFNQSYINPITQEEVVGGTYEILPLGSTYRDEDGIVSMVEYDGKYVPTVGELLSGLLYIVIQSEGKPARKIFFNNTCLPTLFINDDKYYTIDDYILNNNQLMRLCDVKLFSRLGVRIAWKDIAYLDGESVKNMLSNIGSDAHNLWFNNQIGKDLVFFRIYYKGWYMNSASNEDVIFIKGQKKIDVDWNGTTFNNLNEDFSDGVVNNPENGSWIWRDDEEAEVEFMPLYFLKDQDRTFLNYSTGYIAAANVDNHIIKVHLQFGISLILKGYTFNELPDDSYTLQWYKYTESAPPETFSGSITVTNNLTNGTLINRILMNFSPTLQLLVATGLMPGFTVAYDFTIPGSLMDTNFTLSSLTVEVPGATLTENIDYVYTFNKNPWKPSSAPNSAILNINPPLGSRTVTCFFWNNVTVSGSHITINSCTVKFNNDMISVSGTNGNRYHNYQLRKTFTIPGTEDSLSWSTLEISYTIDSDSSGTVINETVTNGLTGDTNKTYVQTDFIDSSDWGNENPTPVSAPSVWTTEFLNANLFRIHIITKPFHLT